MTHIPLIHAVESSFLKTLPRAFGRDYEPREGQREMASVVAGAIEAGGVEVIEAGTGLGKSLAYLMPVVLHCAREGRRAVVSTYTRNLQRQLITNDFPLARRAVGGAAANVTGAVLMGRGNYACRRSVQRLIERRGAADEDWLRAALGDASGELDAMPGASLRLDADTRRKIASPARDAVCAGCRLRADCFMLAARKRALEANVVVTNHALLFSDMALSGALLGPYDVLVVDEAHHLEDVATEFFSLSFTPRSVRGAAYSIYTPEYEETIKYLRSMVAAESEDDARRIDSLWKSFHDALDDADRKAADMFARLGENASTGRGRRDRGARRETHDARAAQSAHAVYQEGAPLWYGAEDAATGASRALGLIEANAGAIVDVVAGYEELSEGGAGAAVRAIRSAAGEARAEYDFLVAGSSEDHVFYAQLGDADGKVSALAASPVDVSARLGAVLEDGSRTAVLTSATLSIDGDFSFAFERLGLSEDGSTRTRRYDSPFDFDESRLVLMPAYLPDPTGKTFLAEAVAVIEDAVDTSGRRALVLCTARSQIAGLERLLTRPRAASRELFLQTDGASREELLERFRRSDRGVLAGLASFWEGIDLPGEDLELLVVLKLPFMVPTEPVTRARSKRVEDSGENPFEKLFLPDAVLKLRQGMGRLIRTSRDRGAVIILDRRLGHSRYGDFILRAITNRHVRCGDRTELIEQLERYFGER